jgi:hypothetical protein
LPRITITQVGPNENFDPAEFYPYVPCFDAHLGGELVVKAWVQLAADAVPALQYRLGEVGFESSDTTIRRLLYVYGTTRLERLCAGLSPENPVLERQAEVWIIKRDDVQSLVDLAAEEPCEYRRKSGRDYYCIAASSQDPTYTGAIDGHRAAPTSLPICNNCRLPRADYLCAMFSHPEVTGLTTGSGIVGRQLTGAMCNAGQAGAGEAPEGCQPGGHDCWRRSVEIEEVATEPHSSPGDLPQALDTLGAFWKLAFGKANKLLTFHSTAEIAELAQECSTREEFRSRMSSWADVINKLSVASDLLPKEKESRTGTLNQLEDCLAHQLPADLRLEIDAPLKQLRSIMGVRTALQHSGTVGGLPASLAKLGIDDAPPNWAGAWARVRSATADALISLRSTLSKFTELSA